MMQAALAICTAQNFLFHSVAPFGIQPVREDAMRSAQKLMFHDYDHDGDLDLFLSGFASIDDADPLTWEHIHYFLEMQENIGDLWNPQFAPRTSMFDEFPFPLGYFFPAAADNNGDDLLDFIMNGEVNYIGNRTMLYAQNTGGQGSEQFESIPFEDLGLDNLVPESFFDPQFVDLDLDGDLDILLSGFDPAFAIEDGPDVMKFKYAKNIGTSTMPEYLGWYSDPYGLTPDQHGELTTSGDIDNDGDIDIVGTQLLLPEDSISRICVHLNNPTPESKPGFSAPLKSPFGLPTAMGEDQFLFPTLVDIDGDGDQDFFVFRGNANGTQLEYHENNLCKGSVSEEFVTICEGDVIEVNGQEISEPGVYEINVLDSTGCSATLIVTVEVIPVVPVFLEETICSGEVYEVGEEEFSEPGSYTITLNSKNGCDSIVFLDLAVIEVNTMVLVNENVLIADLFGATYQWIDCNTGEDIPGATEQSYTVLETGDYAVHITDGSGCSATSECVHVVVTATEDLTYATAVTIYPNPADQVLYIGNTSGIPVLAITITNLAGQTLTRENISGQTFMDISSLQQGVYFVKLEMHGVEIVKKLIVI
jgi:hypothetical protein